MKKITISTFVLMTAFLVSFTLNDANQKFGQDSITKESKSTQNKPVEFMLDPNKSTVAWKGYKIFKSDLSSHNGISKLKEGSVSIDPKTKAIVSGNAVIDMNSFESIDLNKTPDMKAKLDGHLKSADFLDVANFPTVNFKITEFKRIKHKKFNVLIMGDLTIKNATKSIKFKALAKGDKDKVQLKSEAFEINRQDWGITYKGTSESLIKDDVEIEINLLGNRSK
jgi:polyisoprenoid-binding protein YceI